MNDEAHSRPYETGLTDPQGPANEPGRAPNCEALPRYTEAEIKRVFWEIFHGAGELCFPHAAQERENQKVTSFYWEEFRQHLEEARVQQEVRANSEFVWSSSLFGWIRNSSPSRDGSVG